MRLTISAFVLLASSSALAQPGDGAPAEPAPPPESAPPPPPPAPPPPPGSMPAPVDVAPVASPSNAYLPNLLSTAAGTTVDLEVNYIDLDGVDDVTLMSFMAHVQYVTPSNMGGYLRVPVAYIDTSLLGGSDESTTAVGNIEVGGLFVSRNSPTMDIYFRGGVSIDTVDDEDDFFVNLLGHLMPRLIDAYTSAGVDSTWGRAQVGLVASSGILRFGGLVGADIPIEGEATDGLDALINVAGSVGVEQGSITGGVGLAIVRAMVDGDDDSVTNVNLGVGFAVNPKMKLFATLGANVDGFDDFVDGTSFGIGVRSNM